MPEISVIVPVYKVEEYLDDCVHSVLSQTFSDFELILVDDGSPDLCGKICDRWAQQDERIQVIHKQNGGLSSARNAGIDKASGTYIAFIDSDDYVHPGYLQCLHTALLQSGADMALCGIEDVDLFGNPQAIPQYTLPSQAGIFAGRELLTEFFSSASTYYTIAWNKLYRRELWGTLRYPVGKNYEDDAVAHQLFFSCSKVVCIATPLYSYRLRPGSICRASLSPSSFDSLDALRERFYYFQQKGLSTFLIGQALNRCWARYLSLCGLGQADPAGDPALKKKWRSEQLYMRRLLPHTLASPSMSCKQKISAIRWAYKKI